MYFKSKSFSLQELEDTEKAMDKVEFPKEKRRQKLMGEENLERLKKTGKLRIRSKE